MKLNRVHTWGFLLLILNSACIWPWAEPSVLYMSNVVLHLLLGTYLTGVALHYLVRRFRSISVLARLALLLFLLSAIPAFVLMRVGNFRSNRWILDLHIVLALLSAVVVAVALWRYSQRADAPPPIRLAWKGYLAALSILVFLPVVVSAYQHVRPDPESRIQNPLLTPTSMDEEGDGPASPFFPSSATTTTRKTIPSNFFNDSTVSYALVFQSTGTVSPFSLDSLITFLNSEDQIVGETRLIL